MPFQTAGAFDDDDDDDDAPVVERPKQLPWGVKKTQPGAQSSITATKLQAFTIGTNKKTQFHKQREAEELKKKKEEEEAAKVYAEFVASFEEDNNVSSTGWVKGGTLVPKSVYTPDDHQPADTVDPASRLYKPQSRIRVLPRSSVKVSVQLPYEEVPKITPKGKKRNLDSFLEEIKKEHEERDRGKHPRISGDPNMIMSLWHLLTNAGVESLIASEEDVGSHDTGDPDTTNLYVGNLNPAVNEEMLCKEFARYGPIASVKIMWPRTQEERERNRNCGFVSFMSREPAAAALRELDGKDMLGHIMRVGWGKSVSIPSQPIYVMDKDSATTPSGLPFNAQLPKPKGGNFAIPPPGSAVAPPGISVIGQRARPEVLVHRPDDQETVMIIHRMIERVIIHGPEFEALIMEGESENPKFNFLFKNDSPEHVYYRWKLFSLLQGDQTSRWNIETFQMFDEGPVWTPPDIPFDDELDEEDIFSDSDSMDSDDELDRPMKPAAKGPLSKKHRMMVEQRLRKLTFERQGIAQLMVFCIDHSDSADEIVDIVVSSLMIRATPVFPTKIARLYLMSDILHNCSAPLPNVWKFRTLFEARLPEVFRHLGGVWKSITARLRAEQVRRAIFNVLSVWENWLVFPKDFLDGLRECFSEGGTDKERSDKLREHIQNQMEQKTGIWSLTDEDLDGVPMTNLPEKKLEEPRMDSGKWKPVEPDSGRWKPVEAVKVTPPAPSTAADDDDDDEDIDGVPMNLSQPIKPSPQPPISSVNAPAVAKTEPKPLSSLSTEWKRAEDQKPTAASFAPASTATMFSPASFAPAEGSSTSTPKPTPASAPALPKKASALTMKINKLPSNEVLKSRMKTIDSEVARYLQHLESSELFNPQERKRRSEDLKRRLINEAQHGKGNIAGVVSAALAEIKSAAAAAAAASAAGDDDDDMFG
ncbi:hypothetical protein BJ742DRAFT_864575 [Cladochytrium replicatum]|nr:hypothetical protein BJ742DRAFT_864575 [Cladochytrium replicatum]